MWNKPAVFALSAFLLVAGVSVQDAAPAVCGVRIPAVCAAVAFAACCFEPLRAMAFAAVAGWLYEGLGALPVFCGAGFFVLVALCIAMAMDKKTHRGAVAVAVCAASAAAAQEIWLRMWVRDYPAMFFWRRFGLSPLLAFPAGLLAGLTMIPLFEKVRQPASIEEAKGGRE